jgi:hypothetical protein
MVELRARMEEAADQFRASLREWRATWQNLPASAAC